MSKTKTIVFTLILIIGFLGGRKIANYNFAWRTPVILQKPLSITKKVLTIRVTQIVTDQVPLNENEKYLCIKFGNQCKTALQIQHLENGTEQCDRMNVNNNHTVDFGMMQINSVHLNSDVKVADLIDCKKNIDIAYALYQKQGWGIWSTYKLIAK